MLTEGGVLILARGDPNVCGRPEPTPSIGMRRGAEPIETGEKPPDVPFAPTADEPDESSETEPEPVCVETQLYCELI